MSTSETQCDTGDTSPGSDQCSIQDINRRNQAMVDYSLWRAEAPQELPAPNTCPALLKERLSRTQKPTLGNFNPTTKDLFYTLPNMTRDRGRIEVFPRWTNGVPNMDKGGLSSEIDSLVKLGALGTNGPNCHTLAEKNFDRFQPLVPMLASVPDSVYNTDLRVGKFTRDPQCGQPSSKKPQ